MTTDYEYDPGDEHHIAEFTFAGDNFAVVLQHQGEGYIPVYPLQLHSTCPRKMVAEIIIPDVIEIDLTYLKSRQVIVACMVIGNFHEVHLFAGSNLATLAHIVLERGMSIDSQQIKALHIKDLANTS